MIVILNCIVYGCHSIPWTNVKDIVLTIANVMLGNCNSDVT